MPLGALYQDAIAVLETAGVDVAPLRAGGRKLVFRADDGTVFITTRPSDGAVRTSGVASVSSQLVATSDRIGVPESRLRSLTLPKLTASV